MNFHARFPSPKPPDWFRGPASQPPIQGVPEFLHEDKGPGVKLTPHLHLVPTLKIPVAVLLLPTQCLHGVTWNNFTALHLNCNS